MLAHAARALDYRRRTVAPRVAGGLQSSLGELSSLNSPRSLADKDAAAPQVPPLAPETAGLGALRPPADADGVRSSATSTRGARSIRDLISSESAKAERRQ